MAVIIPTYNGELQKRNMSRMLCNRMEKPVKMVKGQSNKFGYHEQRRKIPTNNIQTERSLQIPKFKSLIPIPCQKHHGMGKKPPKSKSHYTQSLIPLMVKSKTKSNLEKSYNALVQGEPNNSIHSEKKMRVTYNFNYPIVLNTKLIQTLCQNLKPLNQNTRLCDITKFVLKENVKVLNQLFAKNSTIIINTPQIIKNPSLLMLPIINVNFNRQVGLLTKYSQKFYQNIPNNKNKSVPIYSIKHKIDEVDSSTASSISSSSLNESLEENLYQLNTIIEQIDLNCTEAETFVEGRNYYNNFMSDFERKSKTSDFVVEVFLEQLKVNTLCGLIDNIFGGLLDDFDDYKKAFLLNKECSFPRFDWMLDENLNSIESNLEPPPIILNIRRIGPCSILVRWNMPINQSIVGYEICINESVKYRVLSAERKGAILDVLNLKSTNNISIYAMTIFGRCYPPAVATYNML